MSITHRGATWTPREERQTYTRYNANMPVGSIETFPNPAPSRDYEIAIACPEFTSLCPKTGLPDFGEIRVTYVPDARCLELKALKYYFIGFRDRGIFYEHVTNKIIDDLVSNPESSQIVILLEFVHDPSECGALFFGPCWIGLLDLGFEGIEVQPDVDPGVTECRHATIVVGAGINVVDSN